MSPVSAKDRIRQMYREPPQRLNAKKRDTRSVAEIQRDIRHSKGIYSDDEDTRSDPRLIRNKRAGLGSRSSSTAAGAYQRDAPMRRMPFRRPTDIRRPPMKRMRHEEEYDEELDEFIVDDEEEEENDVSAEIGRIFRYDRSRYVCLYWYFIQWLIMIHSLDSMMIYSRMMTWKLMHEKSYVKNEGGKLLLEDSLISLVLTDFVFSSERIGRREDIEEEKKELERLKRMKSKGKMKA